MYATRMRPGTPLPFEPPRPARTPITAESLKFLLLFMLMVVSLQVFALLLASNVVRPDAMLVSIENTSIVAPRKPPRLPIISPISPISSISSISSIAVASKLPALPWE